jgi:2-haloacid dehalogenase
MTDLRNIEVVAFDMFSTLVKNDTAEWQMAHKAIVEQQGLPVDALAFWAEWAKHEVQFRKARTNMADPESSPPFKTYWEAWRDAFVQTFEAMGLTGDAEQAASDSVTALSAKNAFPETNDALDALGRTRTLAVLSNADDRFLHGTVAHNGWDCFARVMSSEEAQAYKPDPRIFARFLREMDVAPEAVLYVGDAPYDDAHGAKLAGMRTVLVQRTQDTPGRTPPPENGALLPPDHIVNDLSEIPVLLD